MKNTFIKITFLSLAIFSCNKKTPKTIFDHVRSNNVSEVKTWLEHNDPNTVDEHGTSLLYLATGPKGGNEVLQALIDQGADVNKGAGDYSPLMNAASWVNLEGVQMLVDAGADISAKNADGKTALEVIGDCGACPEKTQVIALLTPKKNPTDDHQIFEGEFVYMADANMFFPCDGSKRMPVEMSGEYLTLEKKYTALAKGTGKRIYTRFKGQIKEVAAMEGDGKERALIIEELLEIDMTKKCK